jgi:hypothetical protein
MCYRIGNKFEQVVKKTRHNADRGRGKVGNLSVLDPLQTQKNIDFIVNEKLKKVRIDKA